MKPRVKNIYILTLKNGETCNGNLLPNDLLKERVWINAEDDSIIFECDVKIAKGTGVLSEIGKNTCFEL